MDGNTLDAAQQPEGGQFNLIWVIVVYITLKQVRSNCNT
jgi:hypothetical protein